MFIGISETTDNRYPETEIRRFSRESHAVEWLMDPKGSGYAWEGGANGSLPVGSQNWHRRLRAVYEVRGYTPRQREVREYMERFGRGSRKVTVATAKASLYREHSTRRLTLTPEQQEEAQRRASAPPTVTYSVITGSGASGYSQGHQTVEAAQTAMREHAEKWGGGPIVFEVAKIEEAPSGTRTRYVREAGDWVPYDYRRGPDERGSDLRLIVSAAS